MGSIKAWLNMAFAATTKESTAIQKLKLKVTLETADMMVKVFWLLEQKKDVEARVLVNQERKKRGFDYDLLDDPKLEERTPSMGLEGTPCAQSPSTDVAIGAQSLRRDGRPEQDDDDMRLSPDYDPDTFDFDSKFEDVKTDMRFASKSGLSRDLDALARISSAREGPSHSQYVSPRKRVLSTEDKQVVISDKGGLSPPQETSSEPPSSPPRDFSLSTAAVFPSREGVPKLSQDLADVVLPSAPSISSAGHPAGRAPMKRLRRMDTESALEPEASAAALPTKLSKSRSSSRSVSAMPSFERRIQPSRSYSLSISTAAKQPSASRQIRQKIEDDADSVETPARRSGPALHSSRLAPGTSAAASSTVSTRRRQTGAERSARLESLPVSDTIIVKAQRKISPIPAKSRFRSKESTSKIGKSRPTKQSPPLPTPPEKRRRTGVKEEVHVNAQEASLIAQFDTFTRQTTVPQAAPKRLTAQPNVDHKGYRQPEQHLGLSISTGASSSASSRAPKPVPNCAPETWKPRSALEQSSGSPKGKTYLLPTMDPAHRARAAAIAAAAATTCAPENTKKLPFIGKIPKLQTADPTATSSTRAPELGRSTALPSGSAILPASGKRQRVEADSSSAYSQPRLQYDLQTKVKQRKPRTYNARGKDTGKQELKEPSTHMDKVLIDAAASAITLQKNPSPPLPNWAEDTAAAPDIPDLPDEEIQTARDHEADSRPTLSKMPPIWATDKSVRALLNNYSQNRPIVLIADDRFKLFPYNLSATNCAQGDPWWLKSDATTTISDLGNAPVAPTMPKVELDDSEAVAVQVQSRTGLTGRPIVRPIPVGDSEIAFRKPDSGTFIKCETCKIQTPQVYKQGWMCLSPQCRAFWKLADGSIPPLHLDYAPRFLELAPPKGFPQSLPSICPATPQEADSDAITTAFAFTKGWHCTKCGRLSSRGFLTNEKGIFKCRSETYEVEGSRGEYIKYVLPYSRGFIHLIRGNVLANGKADEIFEQYQKEAGTADKLVFRRFPMRAHKCRGPLLTNYFSQNSGEPYQYVGGTDNTVPFSDTAQAVNNALELIRTRAEAALKTKPHFNEILSAAYMERQKMAFHSDSERGLGPVVASLSLGSAAHMHFRSHARLAEGKENALTLILRHGDVVVMEGADVQDCYE
ncbi:hypothetical protein HWV62_5506 [Athelia sp. TMB]|nr:hypothetical protein HWV62_5506 [Athelia sp. TMB]